MFHRHPAAVGVHMMISSFCVFRLAHRHTFGALVAATSWTGRRGRYRTMAGDLVVGYLTEGDG